MTIPLCKSQLLALDDQSDLQGDDDKFPAEQRTILMPLAHDAVLQTLQLPEGANTGSRPPFTAKGNPFKVSVPENQPVLIKWVKLAPFYFHLHVPF